MRSAAFGARPKDQQWRSRSTREQRDAIYYEITLDLNGLTDLWTEFDAGNYDRAKDPRQRFEFDMRLLDDLSWEPEQDHDEFVLTMDGVDLAAAISHLITQTGTILPGDRLESCQQSPVGLVSTAWRSRVASPRRSPGGLRTAQVATTSISIALGARRRSCRQEEGSA